MAVPGTFASAVRTVAALRPSVLSGAIGAAAACSLAFGAMAADRVEPNAPDAALVRTAADFYGRGLDAIAQADLSSLSPREAVMTLKAMARGTLSNGPAAAFGWEPEDAPARRAALGNGVEAMSEFLSRLADRPVITARITQGEAAQAVRRARADLRADGVEAGPTKLDFAGIVEEMEHTARAKSGAVSTLDRMAKDGTDVSEMVELAMGAQMDSIPAKRALMRSLADHFLADPSMLPADRDRLVRAMGVQTAADGAFKAVEDMYRGDGPELGPDRIGRIAEISKASLATLAGNDPNLAPEPEAAPAAAPGR